MSGDTRSVPVRMVVPEELLPGAWRLGLSVYDPKLARAVSLSADPTSDYPEVQAGNLRVGQPPDSAKGEGGASTSVKEPGRLCVRPSRFCVVLLTQRPFVLCYLGFGGTRQAAGALLFPDPSTAMTWASPLPVMCQATALLGPPSGLTDGVAPGACVYLIRTPEAYGPKTVPLPVSITKILRALAGHTMSLPEAS